MARQARMKSAIGIYHVMLKGLDGRMTRGRFGTCACHIR